MVTPWLRRQQGKISQKAVYDSPLLYRDHDRPAVREMAVQMAYASLTLLLSANLGALIVQMAYA
ncbi:hypothetical protein L208DRAFT_1400111 [Tricholoma matsutake]|nr:hypothetical protein L208DRAFT_1400111 [Tricholoma matsutake 945]